jgi:hypothetical protein
MKIYRLPIGIGFLLTALIFSSIPYSANGSEVCFQCGDRVESSGYLVIGKNCFSKTENLEISLAGSYLCQPIQATVSNGGAVCFQCGDRVEGSSYLVRGRNCFSKTDFLEITLAGSYLCQPIQATTNSKPIQATVSNGGAVCFQCGDRVEGSSHLVRGKNCFSKTDFLEISLARSYGCKFN